jgi:hypothetical protein
VLTLHTLGILAIGGLAASRTLIVNTIADLNTIVLSIGVLAARKTLTVDTSANPFIPRDTSNGWFGRK